MKLRFNVTGWTAAAVAVLGLHSSPARSEDQKRTVGSGSDYTLETADQVRATDFANIDKGDFQVPQALKGAGANVKLMQMSPKQLDELYVQLTSGPIPSGFLGGKATIPPNEMVRKLLFLEDQPKAAALGLAFLNQLPENLWSGKFFQRELDPNTKQPYASKDDPKRVWLLNRINLTGERLVSPQQINARNMLFPAKVYCGQSLFDSRRESIVIDYKYGQEDFPQYLTDAQDPLTKAQRLKLDWVAGPRGLAIRDEIRMVRPGLYLGRAYVHGAFLLYFALESGSVNADAPAVANDDCWIGHQRQLARNKATGKQSDYINITDNGRPAADKP